jgi:hypothetical protein
MTGKISELTALTGANVATDDEFEIRDTSAGTSGSKRIVFTELKKALGLPSHEVWIYRNSNQSISNATLTDVAFSTELYDPQGIWSATSYVEVPTGCTQFMGWANGQLTGTAGQGFMWLEERNSGGTVIAQHARMAVGLIGDATMMNPSCGWQAATAGNRIYTVIFHSGGAAKNLLGAAWPQTGAPPANMQLWFR